jgi:hypothetical protein
VLYTKRGSLIVVFVDRVARQKCRWQNHRRVEDR